MGLSPSNRSEIAASAAKKRAIAPGDIWCGA
jgi:hypothetical protein